MRNLFAVVLWGDDYVRNFLSVCLPTLLSPGNLGAQVRDRDSRFLIVTTRDDAARIRSSSVVAALREHVEVEFLIISRPKGANKYTAVSRQQMKILHRSAAFDTIFFIYPDFVFSDGAIAYALQQLAAGSEAVVLPVPRLVEEILVPALSRFGMSHGPALAITPSDLIGVASRCLHPSQFSYEWGSAEMSNYPSTLLWKVAAEGLLFRCFHLHPLAMRVQHHRAAYNATFTVSLDEEYLPRVFPDIDGIHSVADSDEAVVCSLSPASFDVGRIPSWQKPDVLFLARWAEGATATLHRQFVKRSYRWHQGPTDPEAWGAAEKRSLSDIQPILDRLAIPSSILRIEDPFAYRQRRRRLRRFRYWRGSLHRVPLRINSLSTKNLATVFLVRLVWHALAATRSLNLARRVWERLRYGRRQGEGELRGKGELASFVRITEGVPVTALAIELIKRVSSWS